MKTVLVPTDFSANAQNALQYAVSLIAGLDAHLHLIHTVQARSGAGHLASVEDIIIADSQTQLDRIVAEKQPALQNPISSKIVQNYMVDGVCQEADQAKASLIVLGTQGASGFKKWFLGSNTSKLIDNTTVPVLAVPAETNAFKLNKIVFAIAPETFVDVQILDTLLVIAKAFNASIELVKVVEKGENKALSVSPELANALTAHNITYTSNQIQHLDVQDAILEYGQKQGADLICAISRSEQRSWWQNLFHESVSTELAYRSQIPFLILHAPAH